VVNIKPTGIYTGTNSGIDSAGNGTIPLVTQFVSGTSDTVRTIVQGDPSGTRPHIQRASFYCTYATAAAARHYQTIRHLKIDGLNASGCANQNVIAGGHITFEDNEIFNTQHTALYVGGYNSGPGSGPDISPAFVARNNSIHDTGGDGQGYGFYITQHGATVEGNDIYNTKGQAGQFTSDVWQVNNGLLRRNYMHDMKRGTQVGYSGHCNGVSFEGTGSEAYDNIFDTRNCESNSTTGSYALEIGYHAPASLKAYNNIFLTASTFLQHAIHVRSTITGAQTFINNVLVVPNGNPINDASGGGATITKTHNACTAAQTCTTANKTTITDYTDILVSTSNFTHKVGSLGIDVGTTSPYRSCVDVCDLGAFEVLKFGNASIDLNVMDVTIRGSRLPILPSAGVTGLTVGCTGTNCGTPVVATAIRQVGTDSNFRLTLSGIGGPGTCDVAQTWTNSATSSNITDGIWVGPISSAFSTGFVQGLHNYSSQPVTEVCTGSGTTPPAGLKLHYKVDENTGTNLNDETANNLDGTKAGTSQWVTGLSGYGIHLDIGDVANRATVPFGNALNFSTNSFSACLWVLPDTANLSADRIVFGSAFASSQRFSIGWAGSKWQIGIQGSGLTGSGSSEFPVSAAWTRVCVVSNSGTDVATLYINGVKGTSTGTSKAYTSYALTSDVAIGCAETGFDPNGCGGITFDEPKVWENIALTDQQILDDFTSYTPPTPPPSSGVFAQVAHKWQRPFLLGGVAQDIGGNNATATVVQNGMIAAIFQVDCTGGACPSMNPRARYNKAGGSFLLGVPDVMGPDGIEFAGAQSDPNANTGTVVCCLSGVLTPTNGPTLISALANPNIVLAQNSSITVRHIVRVGTGANPGDTFCLKLYDQNGNPMNAYTPSGGACFTVTGPTGGYASLSEQPTGLTVAPNPMWGPRPSRGWLDVAARSLW
jgi:hypothetical protein